MPPSNSIDNMTDCLLADAKPRTNFFLGCSRKIKASDFFYIARFQLGSNDIFSARGKFRIFFDRTLVPSFFDAIRIIVQMSSYPKMIWVHAKLVVTRMANKFSGWNLPKMNHPRESVRPVIFQIFCAPDPHIPISTCHLSFCSPNPAGIIAARLVNLAPKSLNVFWGKWFESFGRLWDFAPSVGNHIRCMVSMSGFSGCSFTPRSRLEPCTNC